MSKIRSLNSFERSDSQCINLKELELNYDSLINGEPAWFVLADGNYRGPYSAGAIHQRLLTGRLGSQNYVWSAGMGDWQRVCLVGDFAESAQLATEEFIEYEIDEPQPDAKPYVSTTLPKNAELTWVSQLERSMRALEDSTELTVATPTEASAQAPTTAPPSKLKTILIAIACVATVGAGVARYFVTPSLPVIADITADERESLQAVLRTSFRQGPQGNFIVSQANLREPRFYIATNLPENTKVTIEIEGVHGTLLDSIELKVASSVEIKNGFAQTADFKPSDYRSLPLGSYDVALYTPDGALLKSKRLFLGGTRDSEYEKRLAVYHAQLATRANGELIEVKQMTETVANQLAELNRGFSDALRSRDHGRGWAQFSAGWLAFESQLDTMFSQWKPEVLKRGFYYPDLYLDLTEAESSVSRLHVDQKNFLKAGLRDQSTVAQLAGASERIESMVGALRAKTTLIERLGLDSSGLPARAKP